MSRYSNTERLGVDAASTIFNRDIGWIFREQPVVDMGIDAHVECVKNGNPTGQLLGLQIKSGQSHFVRTAEGLVFRGKLVHLDYWLGHALPVVLIAHLPESRETYWVQVTDSACTRCENSWTILIPSGNKLDAKAKDQLEIAVQGTPRQQRLRQLALDEGLMRRVQSGGKVSVDLQDWINKSLGRSPITVYVHDEDGREQVALVWFILYTGYRMKGLVERVFPWATASVDEDFYEDSAELDSDYLSARRCNSSDGVYPYAESGGEVESYRLRLDLNDLGVSYLLLADYLAAD